MAYSLCGSSVDNTGEQNCDKAKGVLSRIAIDNGIVAEADYASAALFHTRLVAKSKLGKKDNQKLFILPEIQDIVTNKQANQEGSLNQGFTTVLREGKPGYKIKFFGGADLLRRCKTFDNQTVRIREYDVNTVWWGTKTGTDSRGYLAKLFFTGGDAPTGQNVEEGVIECTVSILSTSEYYKNSYWIDSTGNVDDLKALLDVNLRYVSHVSNVLKYAMEIPGANQIGPYNIGPEVGTEIAALAAQFTAKSAAGALPITSMSYDSANQLLAVTYDNTDYGTATGNITLTPPTPTQLDSGDVPETELLEVSHAKPA